MRNVSIRRDMATFSKADKDGKRAGDSGREKEGAQPVGSVGIIYILLISSKSCLLSNSKGKPRFSENEERGGGRCRKRA